MRLNLQHWREGKSFNFYVKLLSVFNPRVLKVTGKKIEKKNLLKSVSVQVRIIFKASVYLLEILLAYASNSKNTSNTFNFI